MKRCLIIDDSRVIRTVARAILEGLHFEVSEAEDAAKALDNCRRAMPELILLDFDPPNSAAAEFLRKLRLASDGGRPVVVFCAMENDVGQISEALAAGADDYVQKPFDLEALVTKLANAGLIDNPASLAPAA